MQNYVIITDATGDLTPALAAEAGVEVIPMEFSLDGKNYRHWPDEREMPINDFYAKMRTGATATTAQVNSATYCDWARPHLCAGEDVLFLIFSSGMSGSFHSCTLAAEELREEFPDRTIVAVDTLAAAMGEGLLVFYAAQKKRAGADLAEVADWVTSNRDHLCHWFTVDELSYLYKGGRLSATSAMLGTMLNIKPVLHVDAEGHLVAMEKVRGRRQSMDAMLRRLNDTILDNESPVVFIGHGDCEADAQYLAEQITGTHGIKRVEIGRVGPVIGSHTGPGILELFFLGKEK